MPKSNSIPKASPAATLNQKLEPLLDPPSEKFVNPAIRRLCESKNFQEEISKFETSKIKIRNKSVEILRILNQDQVDIPTLTKLSFTGIPDLIRGVRPVVWRLILGALPHDTSNWEKTQLENYETYENFKKELIVKPRLKQEEEEAKEKQRMIDHPLSTAQTSVWNTFFKDQEIWDEIEKDVKRTRTDMYYFYLALDPSRNRTADDLSRLERQAETKRADLKPEDRFNYIETHADVLHRILFIYAKLNPGVKYIQGMNEVLAVIYYCYLNCDNYEDDREGKFAVFDRKFHESDLFFSFSNIMGELKDGFLRELDKEKSGIQGRIKAYADIMKVTEPHAYHTIETNQVNH